MQTVFPFIQKECLPPSFTKAAKDCKQLSTGARRLQQSLVFTKYCKDQGPLFIMPRRNSLQSFTYRYSSTHLIVGKYEFISVKY